MTPQAKTWLSVNFFLLYGIYQDIICTIYPESWVRLDIYMTVFDALHLEYRVNTFFILQQGSGLHCSVQHSYKTGQFCKEIIIMLIGGSSVFCSTCGNYPIQTALHSTTIFTTISSIMFRASALSNFPSSLSECQPTQWVLSRRLIPARVTLNCHRSWCSSETS